MSMTSVRCNLSPWLFKRPLIDFFLPFDFAGALDREVRVCQCVAFTKAGNSAVRHIWGDCVLGCCGRHPAQIGDLLEALI
jgi:hypothetical protein